MAKRRYPKTYANSTHYKNIPVNMDAAITDPKDKRVYYLKGKRCWVLDDNTLNAEKGWQYIAHKWFQKDCKGTSLNRSTRAARSTATPSTRRKGDKKPVLGATTAGSSANKGLDIDSVKKLLPFFLILSFNILF